MKYLFDCVANIPNRETVYIIEIVSLLIICALTYLGRVVMSGSGTVLNKTYGKTNYLFATIKHISTAIGFLGMVLLAVFWLVDFISNFFNISLWYVIFAAIGFGVWLYVFFKGGDKEIEKEIQIENKNIKEIDGILESNPVFSVALKVLTENTTIKTVRIYNDGIAFYTDDIPIPQKIKPVIKGCSNFEVTCEIRKILKDWLNKEGSINTSKADMIIKYEDVGFSSANIQTMQDIAKHLSRKLSPRYNCTENKWVITRKDTLYSDGGYSYFNGKITPSSHSKRINVTESATAYFSLNVSK